MSGEPVIPVLRAVNEEVGITVTGTTGIATLSTGGRYLPLGSPNSRAVRTLAR